MDGLYMHDLVEIDARVIRLNTSGSASALVNILKRGCDLETTRHVTKWLKYLAEEPSGLLSIYQSNGIPVLVQLLNTPDEFVLYYTVVILHCLLLYQDGSKDAICEAFGLQEMIRLLKNSFEGFLTVVMDCLRILAYKRPGNKFIIFLNDGPAELVRIMETYSNKNLLEVTVRVLISLTICERNKYAIIAAGGVQALAKHLDNASQCLVVNCLDTLRNLSDAAATQKNVESLFKKLVQFLGSRDKHIVCITAGILSNMVCHYPDNKILVCQERGVRALVKAIVMAENDEEIIEPAIWTLVHLTNNHPEAETAQNDVRLYFGLQAIVKFLNPPSRWPVIKVAIGLVRNLALCPNNHEPLLELGAVQILKNMLHSVYQSILRNRESLPGREMQFTVIDGIRMENIVEFILKAFRNLARNENIRTLLKDSDTTNIFIQIMDKENEYIKLIVKDIRRLIYCVESETKHTGSFLYISLQ